LGLGNGKKKKSNAFHQRLLPIGADGKVVPSQEQGPSVGSWSSPSSFRGSFGRGSFGFRQKYTPERGYEDFDYNPDTEGTGSMYYEALGAPRSEELRETRKI
jgi:hypothetical protein